MSLSGPRRGTKGSAEVRRRGPRPPGSLPARRGASHGARPRGEHGAALPVAHLAVGQVSRSSRDSPRPAPPAAAPPTRPAGPSAARRGGNACALGEGWLAGEAAVGPRGCAPAAILNRLREPAGLSAQHRVVSGLAELRKKM